MTPRTAVVGKSDALIHMPEVSATDAAREFSYLFDDHDDAAIAAVTLTELMTGVHLATPHRRPARIGLIEALLEAIPVVPHDLIIAATATSVELLA